LRAHDHDLLQDVAVQREIGHQPLQLTVLLTQLPQFPQLAQTQSGILLLPQVKRLLADRLIPCLRQISTTVSPDSASLRTRRIASSLCPRFAIFRPSSLLKRTTTSCRLSTSERTSFWVLGHKLNGGWSRKKSRYTEEQIIGSLKQH
jgi:hypothetical protein